MVSGGIIQPGVRASVHSVDVLQVCQLVATLPPGVALAVEHQRMPVTLERIDHARPLLGTVVAHLLLQAPSSPSVQPDGRRLGPIGAGRGFQRG